MCAGGLTDLSPTRRVNAHNVSGAVSIPRPDFSLLGTRGQELRDSSSRKTPYYITHEKPVVAKTGKIDSPRKKAKLGTRELGARDLRTGNSEDASETNPCPPTPNQSKGGVK
jgi:hypothetical protein